MLVSYCEESETFRQLPQNYLLAGRGAGGRSWICDPDLAADKDVAVMMFKVLLVHENKYGTPEKVLDALSRLFFEGKEVLNV